MAVRDVVLVHGAFADGSSWAKVIPLLLDKGYRVTSVAIPLTSFAEDVAATKRATGLQEGPVLLVGHSYGGVVITEAGNDPKVAALVYVAAFAPDAKQSIGEISQSFPKPPGLDALRPLPDGYLLLAEKGIREDFAQDLTQEEKALLVAVQPQTAGAIFEAKPEKAAWRNKPSWYVVASNDRMIAPEQEQAMAANIRATVKKLPSSHAVMLSHPKEVADVIAEAAQADSAA
ncbi:MAG TPA: alpha/beta hydrolase [Polyangiaceae bacterium]|nr:alpha/beta hydrolase [Polyangiaceae bacterium]